MPTGHFDMPAIAAAITIVNEAGGSIDTEELEEAHGVFSKDLVFELSGYALKIFGKFEMKREFDSMNLSLSVYTPDLNPLIANDFYRLLNKLNWMLPVGTFIFSESQDSTNQVSEFSLVTSIKMVSGNVNQKDVESSLKYAYNAMKQFIPAVFEFISAKPILRVNTLGRVCNVRPGVDIETAAQFVFRGKFGTA